MFIVISGKSVVHVHRIKPVSRVLRDQSTLRSPNTKVPSFNQFLTGLLKKEVQNDHKATDYVT